VYEFYARGPSYAALHEHNLAHSKILWDRYVEDTSFKFIVDAYNHRVPKARQRDVVESFSYMGFLGKIDMTSPDIVLTVLEECAFSYRPHPFSWNNLDRYSCRC
jgi:tRNA (guanine10-N2)-methyltransferase